ncbi:DUF5808 domain-containing protein [Streptantibioticus parmotrematis]|uniref:DUF1648 domain-containing protein n=1 Tax=Streptantibioticus parmotrematis TaxID=2873249 RepID=UPI0033CBF802
MNAVELLVNAVIPLTVLVVCWLLPALADPALPFGVRTPAERRGAPVIAEQRARYRWTLGTGGLAVVVTGTAVSAVSGHSLAGVTPPLVFAVFAAAYLRAHRAVRAVKRREDWYGGLRQGAVADTSLRTDPPHFPWLWAMPSLLVTGVTAVVGALRYPSLPPRLPMHFDAAGHVDHYTATSVGSAFAPVFFQLGLTALLVVVARLCFVAGPRLDPAHPGASARRYRRGAVRAATGLLLLPAFVDLTLLIVALFVWNGTSRPAFGLTLLPTAVGLVVVVYVSLRPGPNFRQPLAGTTSRPGQADEGQEDSTGLVAPDDDRFWRAGLFYFNRSDPAVLVPKRFGVGRTVNFANPRAVLALVALVSASVVVPLLTR